MCEISTKLKLCTCKTEAVEALKHYWILSKPDEHGITTIGLILPPAFIGEEVEKLNIKTLTDLLNSGHCFDITLDNRDNDILDLHFTCKSKYTDDSQHSFTGDYIAYSFVYKKGKWHNTGYDPFDKGLLIKQTGKIVRPFINRKNDVQNVKHQL